MIGWITNNANSITAISTAVYTLITFLLLLVAFYANKNWEKQLRHNSRINFLANAMILKEKLDSYYNEANSINKAELDDPQYLAAWLSFYEKATNIRVSEGDELYKDLIRTKQFLFLTNIDKKKTKTISNLIEEFKKYKEKINELLLNKSNLYHSDSRMREASLKIIQNNKLTIEEAQENCQNLLEKTKKFL